MNLADITRTVARKNLTRNELKVVRARLRRLGLTNRSHRASGPYTILPHSDMSTDVRAVEGTLLVSAIAESV